MATTDKYKWTILYTDHQKQFIHYNHLIKSNPDANIIKVDISNNLDKKYIWRNSDLLIRSWLKNNRDSIVTNNIAIIEWDVLVKQKLPDTQIIGLQAKNIIKPNRKWWWFKDKYKLEHYSKYALGAAPLAVLFMSARCIDILLESSFDCLYQKDIFSELRIPTILNSRNITITSYSMPNVDSKKTMLKSEAGIYHPIKYNVL